MKRAALLSIGLLLAVVAWSQSDMDYQKWMKDIGATCGSLKKNLGAKNGEAAAADAKKLHSDFVQVQMFFEKKHSDDAKTFAMNASEGFNKIAMQASASKFDDATATFKATTANCGGCHDMHREKAADGSFKIKY